MRIVVTGVCGTIGQETFERRPFAGCKCACALDEVPVTRGERADRMPGTQGREGSKKFRDAERRQRGATAQGENFGHAKL